ncbi:MAG: SEC-C metal-binding domain-containing protein, partial [Planctomycetaceae bacterium]
HFPERALCAWLNQQFALEMEPQQFKKATVEEAHDLILDQVQEMYDEKEVRFPVDVGMHNFLADRNQSERQGRESLLKWASDRFETDLHVDQFKNKTRDDIEAALVDCSRRFQNSGDFAAKIDGYLDRAYGSDEENGQAQGNGYSGNGSAGGNGEVPHAEVLAQLTQWANEEFRADLKTEDFEELGKDDARRRLLGEVESRYRPELSQTERSLLLEILDTAWKEHLYHMGHVKETIGLESYAGKDPKVEYKKEGRRAFNAMWERVGQQVTAAIFRLELESDEFEGAMWDIGATIHEDFVENFGGEAEQFDPEMPAVETIRNRGPRVGRNDPCPCGSGKKYKKCCGRGA